MTGGADLAITPEPAPGTLDSDAARPRALDAPDEVATSDDIRAAEAAAAEAAAALAAAAAVATAAAARVQQARQRARLDELRTKQRRLTSAIFDHEQALAVLEKDLAQRRRLLDAARGELAPLQDEITALAATLEPTAPSG